MAASFNVALADFQTWAKSVSPQFAANIDEIVSRSYISQLGEMTVEPITNRSPAQITADKIGDFVKAAGDTYLKTVEAYYKAQGKVADLKLAAQGSPSTQVVNTAQGAIAAPPTNLLMLGGLGLLAVLLISRR